jgi:hypothetical protein
MIVDNDVKTFGSPRSLRAFTHVGLDVGRVPQPLRDQGLGELEITKLARARLEPVPFQVLTRTGALHVDGAPTLVVDISLVELDAASHLYSVDLELTQGVHLERLRDPDVAMSAPTWRAQAVGVAQTGQLPSLGDKVAAVVDAFGRDLPDE